jgi:tetratricopeptide (TPR) repeat protein
LAWVHILTGREEEAIDAADEAIEVARGTGATVAESNAAALRGMAAYALEDLDEAEEWFRITLTLECESGLALAVCFAEWGLGAISRRRGDFAKAKVRLDTAAQAATYAPWFRGRVLLEQARLAADEDDPVRASELAHDGADVLVAIGDQPGACEAVEVLAGLAAGRGQPSWRPGLPARQLPSANELAPRASRSLTKT